ncbi:MBL fold metallo-hydrolase [Bacillus luteolus]|uniref:MBL fold metallo-hydrolase n=1 Tax=Litchfieldia luteola TaxID=682179 RepID=A0ABR9QHJ5_9BACI|nr:MBL fold metallo-hydrolase [Cytobacillus luteolus]MBE4907959.1 MBL fold metallo-hydrolase [Cytobacillus luteolus]MBP1942739.1 glyoxylase-like metal-dependent hydrolase (beta-lactamase superfamily II) [Cytobacillus luteolus]
MKWQRVPLGPLSTNAYILSNQQKECVIFDPGGDDQKLISTLNRQGLKPVAILLTHAHFDHIGAVDEVRNQYGIKVYIHESEKKWLGDSSLNGSRFFMGNEVRINDADVHLKEEGKLTVGSFTFELFHTPGHSPGSVSFYHEEAEVVFSGDALFAGSIGRTDLPGGNSELLLSSIHKKLLSLPEETIVLSGHGPETTIQAEMDDNPFLHGF